MRFKIDTAEISQAVSNAQTLSALGAASGIRQPSSVIYSSILIEASEDGTVTFTSENAFGAGFRAKSNAEVSVPGAVLADMSELATVLGVFVADNVTVSSVESKVSGEVYEVQVIDADGQEATAIAHGVNDRSQAPRLRDVDGTDTSTFEVSMSDFRSAWSTGGACTSPANDNSQVLAHVYLSFDDNNVHVESSDRKTFAFANAKGVSDGGEFYGMVRPENMNRVLNILGPSGADHILFKSIRPDDEHDTADRAFAVIGLVKDEHGNSKVVAEIRMPLGHTDSSNIFHDGVIAKTISSVFGKKIADINVPRDTLNASMGRAARICSLIPDKTGGMAKNIAVIFGSDGADISLPDNRFDGFMPLETDFADGSEDLDLTIRWGFVSDLVASTPPSDDIFIRSFGAVTKSGKVTKNVVMCLYEDGDWAPSETGFDYPGKWMIMFTATLNK